MFIHRLGELNRPAGVHKPQSVCTFQLMLTAGRISEMRGTAARIAFKLMVGLAGYFAIGFINNMGPGVEGMSWLWNRYHFFELAIALFNTFSVWWANSALFNSLNKRLTWDDNPIARLLVNTLASTALSLTLLALPWVAYFKFAPLDSWSTAMAGVLLREIVLMGLAISFIVNAVYAGLFFFRQWRGSYEEVAMLKEENLRSQFESLKSQINPHFLFNSLNTLSTLTEEDPKLATTFTEELARVYRYILQTRDRDLITLREELQFINAFVFLLRVRFSNNLQYEVHVPEHWLVYGIPPLTLQMLVENAIKHNVVSKQRPLRIHISVNDEQMLVVANTLQKKTVSVQSNKVGLQNIHTRYRLIGSREIEIFETEDEFLVYLPLLPPAFA